MSLIDKYIFREWGKAFLLALLAMLGVLLLEDMYDDLGDFIDFGAKYGDIFRYYVVMVPSFLPVILPTALLLSLLFILGGLNRNHEITAMRAAGLSLFRITRSLWVASVMLAGILFYLNAQLVPWSVENSKLIWDNVRFKTEAIKSDSGAVGLIHLLAFDNRSEGRLWFINSFSEYTYEGYGISVFERDGFGSERRRVLAEEGYYDDHTGYWVLQKGRELLFDSSGEPTRSLVFEKREFPEFTEQPKLMTALSKKPENLSVLEMKEILKSISPKENPNVHRYAISYARICLSPLSCLIVIAIAIPLATSGVRANPLIGVSKAIGLFFAYYLLGSISGIMGAEQLVSPWVAAWIPNIVMAGFAWFLCRKLV